jgi:Cdc6-like AAA superfamily ATPase
MTVTISSSSIILIKHFIALVSKTMASKSSHEDIVTVIGSPGCGKTTAIHHVALRLNKEQLYDVVPAVYPSDIRDYYDPERKQVLAKVV